MTHTNVTSTRNVVMIVQNNLKCRVVSSISSRYYSLVLSYTISKKRNRRYFNVATLHSFYAGRMKVCKSTLKLTWNGAWTTNANMVVQSGLLWHIMSVLLSLASAILTDIKYKNTTLDIITQLLYIPFVQAKWNYKSILLTAIVT